MFRTDSKRAALLEAWVERLTPSHSVNSSFSEQFSKHQKRCDTWNNGAFYLLNDLTILKVTPKKARATHSSILAWIIPWTEFPWRVVHDLATKQHKVMPMNREEMGCLEQKQVRDAVRVSDGPGSIWVKTPCASHPSVHPLCLPPVYPAILSPIRLIQSSIHFSHLSIHLSIYPCI